MVSSLKRICLKCGKEFVAKDYRSKFCSRSCSASYNNNLVPRRKAPERFCLNCGKKLIKQSQRKYCSNQCQQDYEYKQFIEKWKSKELNGQTGIVWDDLSKHIRRYLFEKYDYKCARCGWSETNSYSGTIPLEVEHINGNYQDNDEDNLTLLCPNCHSLTEFYKGANKGKQGRKRTYVPDHT